MPACIGHVTPIGNQFESMLVFIPVLNSLIIRTLIALIGHVVRILKKHINNLWSEKKWEKISRKSSKLPLIKWSSYRLIESNWNEKWQRMPALINEKKNVRNKNLYIETKDQSKSCNCNWRLTVDVDLSKWNVSLQNIQCFKCFLLKIANAMAKDGNKMKI